MPSPIVGLHHVTAIAADPQQNLDFYTQALGLRFVKRTVNFDDPGSYHFYFGNDLGEPGTIMTFFAWPRASRGMAGTGETIRTAFAAPKNSLDFWKDRLRTMHVPIERSEPRFGETVLTLADPDGTKIEIVGQEQPAALTPSRYSDVPSEYALRGFAGVTLAERSLDRTAGILNTMGFRQAAVEGNRYRFEGEGGAPGNHVDVLVDANGGEGMLGAGSVHHIAFRAADDAAQLEWRATLAGQVRVTDVLDRTYFHSIYFREPGGVLFEIATDPPGFTVDEPAETLGEALKLPPWLETHRSRIEQHVPPIELHKPQPAQP